MKTGLPAALAVALCLVGCSTAAAPHPAPARHSSPATTTAPPAAPVSSGRRAAEAISKWDQGPGGRAFHLLVKRLTAAGAGITVTRCTRLAAAAGEASAAPPIPDRAAERDYSKALELFGASAIFCSAGLTTKSASALHESVIKIDAASADLNKVTARIRAISAAAG